jgi:hypothetical protein
MYVNLSLERFNFTMPDYLRRINSWKERETDIYYLLYPPTYYDSRWNWLKSSPGALNCKMISLPFLYINFLTWEEKLTQQLHFKNTYLFTHSISIYLLFLMEGSIVRSWNKSTVCSLKEFTVWQEESLYGNHHTVWMNTVL